MCYFYEFASVSVPVSALNVGWFYWENDTNLFIIK